MSAQAGIQGPAMQQRAAANLTDLTFLTLMKGSARKMAIDNALGNLLTAIPQQPKRKRKSKAVCPPSSKKLATTT